MNKMLLKKRIGFIEMDASSFCASCVPYPTDVLKCVHHHLPIVAAEANSDLLIVIKV